MKRSIEHRYENRPPNPRPPQARHWMRATLRFLRTACLYAGGIILVAWALLSILDKLGI